MIGANCVPERRAQLREWWRAIPSDRRWSRDHGPGREMTGNISRLTALAQVGALPLLGLGEGEIKVSSRAVTLACCDGGDSAASLIWPPVRIRSRWQMCRAELGDCLTGLGAANSTYFPDSAIPRFRVSLEGTETRAGQWRAVAEKKPQRPGMWHFAAKHEKRSTKQCYLGGGDP